MIRKSAAICILLFLELAVPARAQDAYTYNNMGLMLLKKGEFAKAAANFQQALALAPENSIFKENLAAAYARWAQAVLNKGRLNDAAKLYQTAIQILPKDPTLYHGLAEVYAVAKNYEYAIWALKNAIAVAPTYYPAYEDTGFLYYQAGDTATALQYWEKALQLGSKNEQMKKLMDKTGKETQTEKGFVKSKGSHFLVKYDGQTNAASGQAILEILENAYYNVGRKFGDTYPKTKVEVVLYSDEEFKKVTGAHTWMSGLYDGKIRIPIKNFSQYAGEIKLVAIHEYTHALIADMTQKTCPAWLNEGLAMTMEGASAGIFKELLSKAKLKGAWFPLSELQKTLTQFSSEEQAALAYGISLSFTTYLISKGGMFNVNQLLKKLGKGQALDAAFKAAYQTSLFSIEEAWKKTI